MSAIPAYTRDMPKGLFRTGVDKIKTLIVKVFGYVSPVQKSPDEGLGELFEDVQRQRVYQDGKVFVDLIPKKSMPAIRQEYLIERKDPNFDLREFVNRHFYAYDNRVPLFTTDRSKTMNQHIMDLWPVLERHSHKDRGSLIALPHNYIVPGGRFNEQFYWDSYFIMLGLAANNRWNNVEGMIRNFAHMIRKFGFIPTANRTYFLSRSQPPFFAYMIELLEEYRGPTVLMRYLPYLVAEHNFWMRGVKELSGTDNNAFGRVVEMPSGLLLNRYYDNKTTPRPESLDEDISAAEGAPGSQSDRLFLHLRAAAESGWDFSSRWFVDANDIKSIYTADIVPVDLNCLLYHLEKTIARAYRVTKKPSAAKRYGQRAERRVQAIMKYCWDDEAASFVDYNFRTNQSTGVKSLAMVFPLYVGIATAEQASYVAEHIKKDFLHAGGLITTLHQNDQQWDKPNGWAPLHWVAIQGLRRYGHTELADEIKRRWLLTNQRVFAQEGKMVEKYNVVDGDGQGGGGEYPLQDGFGWTNGVAAALMSEESIDALV